MSAGFFKTCLFGVLREISITNEQGCGSGPGSGVFALIRIRFSNFSRSGSGFQISLDPDPGTKKGSKRDLLEEKLKTMI